MADFIGSSGTLAAAALETVGYHYQSHVLDALGVPFQTTVGGFVYLIALIIALVTVALGGQFRLGLWLLLGPPIFLSVVKTRVETRGPDWKFGSEIRNRAQLEQQAKSALGRIDEREPAIPKVSGLFAWYNRLISSMVTEVVATLNLSRSKTDLTFLIVPELYSFTASQTVRDPRFRELIHLSFLGECRDLHEAAREMADKVNSPEERCVWARKYKHYSGSQNIRLSKPSVEYLAGLKADYPQAYGMNLVLSPQQELQAFVEEIRSTTPYSCDLGQPLSSGALNPRASPTVPASAYLAQVEAAEASTRNTLMQHFQSESISLSTAQTQEIQQEVLSERDAKVSEAAKEIGSKVYSCHELWNQVHAGLQVEARKVYETALEEGRKRGVPEEQLQRKLAELYGQAPRVNNDYNTVEIYQAIAKRMFRNDASKGSVSAIASYYAQRGRNLTEVQLSNESPLSLAERTRTGLREWQEKSRLMLQAYSMPYYQGVLLYVLALAFPFFALLLLVPGKHGGFLLWFAFWFWVKSWDIGIAIVMLLDQVLHAVFTANIPATTDPATMLLSNDLTAAMLALREGDPTFQVGTYYGIIATAMHSVPVITSYLILGSLRGGYGLIAAGMDRASNGGGTFGAAGGMSGTMQAAQSQETIGRMRLGAMSAQMARTQQSIQGTGTGVPGSSGAGAVSPGNSGNFSDTFASRGYGSLMTNSEFEEASRTSAKVAGFASGAAAGLGGSRDRADGHAFTRARAHGGSMAARRNAAENIVSFGEGGAKFVRDGAKLAMEQSMTLYEKRLATIRAWAEWDSLLTEGQQFAQNARVAGMFEIPWISEGGFDASFEEVLAKWDALAEAIKIGGSAPQALGMGSATNATLGVAASSLARGAVRGAGIVAALSALSGDGGRRVDELDEAEQVVYEPLKQLIAGVNVRNNRSAQSALVHAHAGVITEKSLLWYAESIRDEEVAEGRVTEAAQLWQKFEAMKKEPAYQLGVKTLQERYSQPLIPQEVKDEANEVYHWIAGDEEAEQARALLREVPFTEMQIQALRPFREALKQFGADSPVAERVRARLEAREIAINPDALREELEVAIRTEENRRFRNNLIAGFDVVARGLGISTQNTLELRGVVHEFDQKMSEREVRRAFREGGEEWTPGERRVALGMMEAGATAAGVPFRAPQGETIAQARDKLKQKSKALSESTTSGASAAKAGVDSVTEALDFVVEAQNGELGGRSVGRVFEDERVRPEDLQDSFGLPPENNVTRWQRSRAIQEGVYQRNVARQQAVDQLHAVWSNSKSRGAEFGVPPELLWASAEVQARSSEFGVQQDGVGVLGLPHAAYTGRRSVEVAEVEANVTAGAKHYQALLGASGGDVRGAIEGFYGAGEKADAVFGLYEKAKEQNFFAEQTPPMSLIADTARRAAADLERQTATAESSRSAAVEAEKTQSQASSQVQAGASEEAFLTREQKRLRKLAQKKKLQEKRDAARGVREAIRQERLAEAEARKEESYQQYSGQSKEGNAAPEQASGISRAGHGRSVGEFGMYETGVGTKERTMETSKSKKQDQAKRLGKAHGRDGLEVVRATAKDASSLVPLFNEYRQELGEAADLKKAKQFITERLKNNDSVIFMAVQKEDGAKQAVGFLQMFPIFDSVTLKQSWMLTDVYVMPERRAESVGRRLHSAARDYAQSAGSGRLIARTPTDGTDAQAFLEKLGFVIDEQSHYFVG